MDVCFEISDRFFQELGPWPLALGAPARAVLYAFLDHSSAQHGGRLLLPDIALAPSSAPFCLHRAVPPLTAFCGMIGALRTSRREGRDRREETTLRLECGVPLTLIVQTYRWESVDVAPAVSPAGLEYWQAARPPRVADVLSGVLELQELAFEVGGVSSFPLLGAGMPDLPLQGTVTHLERLHLDPSSSAFGTLTPVETLPHTTLWPHRYFVTLAI